MKNRTTVEHGMLPDLESYLVRSGWTLEEPVGQYEVLRARRPGYPPAAPDPQPIHRGLRLQH